MTTEQFIDKLNAKLKAIEDFDKPLELSVRSVMALQSNRIFFNGKNTEGGIIGKYVQKGIYISQDITKKLGIAALPEPLKGKGGESKFKNGKPHKTGYFENFLGFKKAVGKGEKINTVDLFLSGKLHRDWANAEIGEPAEATKINQHNYVVSISEENHNKVERYGRVFNLSIAERLAFFKTITFELKRALT